MLRRSGHALALLMMVLMPLMLVACSRPTPDGPEPTRSAAGTPAPDTYQAVKLMSRFSLEASGDPATGTMTVDPEGMTGQLVSEATSGSGLPLDRDFGVPLQTLTYSLTQRTDAGSVDAVFLYRNGSVVGGYLNLHGYYPSLASLNETFAPLR